MPMRQEYEKYTAEDHQVWSLLYAKQMQHLPELATEAYLAGMKKCKFEPDRVPDFNVVNEALEKITGWQVYVVPGLIDNKPFFEHLSRREFPATTWLRRMDQLEYLEEPDMFHDVFGHIPLLSEPFFCDYLNGLSKITLQHIDNPNIVEIMARLYWYTVEFGLICEKGQLRIYGAGILSSSGESLYCVSEQATHVDFDVQRLFETPYVKEGYQKQYFVIDSYQQLFDSLPDIQALVQRYVEQAIEVAPSYA